MLTLHTYFRSSAAYRVRIALNLKGLEYRAVPVHLLRGGGQHRTPEYARINPAQLVPVLQDEGVTITQSLAIIEYLEQTRPLPPLLPAEAAARAHVRALALNIACDIHPINNLRVMQYLKDELSVGDNPRNAWSHHWIELGLRSFEQLLGVEHHDRFCYGDTPTLADCCLVPQLFNAQRLEYPLDAFPVISRIYAECMQLPAFQQAAPAAQPDAV